MMRLLYVTPGIGGGGGAERSLVSMVPYWQDKLELRVVTFSERTHLASRITDSGASFRNLGPQHRHALLLELRKEVREFEPDLVHSVLFDADLLARLATPSRVPVSCSLVNVNYLPLHAGAPRRSAGKLRLARALDAVTAQRVSRFHALSTNVADVMAERLLVSRSKIEVISRGRDRAELGYWSPRRRQEVRGRLGVGDAPLVVAAARHEWQKGLDLLIAAVPALRKAFPDVRVLIGGPSGHETERLEQLLIRVGLDPGVVLIGPRDDVPDLMCAADVFCVPSRWEGLGSILVEAMGLGARVVAADIAPIRELDPDARWLTFFEPENADALARALQVALSDETGRQRAEHAMATFERSFQSEQVASRMLAFFRRAAYSG